METMSDEPKSVWAHNLGAEVLHVQGDKFTTRCLVAGDRGELPIIFIHGIGGHLESFAKNVVPLARELDDREIYSIDLIGHGYSSMTGTYTLEKYADQVEELIYTRGYERAHVHGESLGGMIATWLAIERPKLLKSIGLNTTARIHGDIHEKVLEEDQIRLMKEEKQELYDRTEEMMSKGYPRDLVQRRVEWLFHRDPPSEITDIRYHVYQREIVQKHMGAVYGAKKPYFEENDFLKIDTPTLIVHTKNNPGTPWQTMEYIHSKLLDDSRFHVYENSAHWPQWEQASNYNDDTKDFVRSFS